MQNLFRISKSWHDPVPGPSRTGLLILSILLIESASFLLKDNLRSLPSIYLLGGVRGVDIAILLIWGSWSMSGTYTSGAARDALVVSLSLTLAGLFLLTLWKSCSEKDGVSMSTLTIG